jgi:hypothetical protein
MPMTKLRFALAGSVVIGALAVPAIGQADPLPAGCTKDRGTITCVERDEAGNSGRFKTTETTQKGSFQSSHEEDTTFTNPGGNQPAGQQ